MPHIEPSQPEDDDDTSAARRRAEIRAWLDLAVHAARSLALIAMMLSLAGLVIYHAVAEGQWLPAAVISAAAAHFGVPLVATGHRLSHARRAPMAAPLGDATPRPGPRAARPK